MMRLWVVVGRCRCILGGYDVVVAGFGWLWVVLAGCGWLWLVVAGFGSFLVLVCTDMEVDKLECIGHILTKTKTSIH